MRARSIVMRIGWQTVVDIFFVGGLVSLVMRHAERTRTAGAASFSAGGSVLPDSDLLLHQRVKRCRRLVRGRVLSVVGPHELLGRDPPAKGLDEFDQLARIALFLALRHDA